jgi:phage-related minor tail protein
VSDLQAGGAYIQLLPSMAGFFDRIRGEMRGAPAVEQDITPRVSEQDLAKARRQVEAATEKVVAARRKEADSAGAVRVAEAQLQDLRERGNASASQIAAAEEKVETARRRSQAAMEALQRAEAGQRSATTRVERLELQADTEQADNEIDQFGNRNTERMRTFGRNFALAAAAGIAAAGAAVGLALAGAMDVQASRSLLQAQLGLTAEESERAGRLAGQLWQGAYGESLDEVNTALRGVATNIGDLGSFSDEALTGMGAKALDLAKIMGEDVGRVTRGVGQLMRNGLAPDATTAFDLITAAAQRLPAEMQGELLDTVEEYGSDLSQLGLTGEQAFGALSAAVGAGARNVDLAADGFRELSIRAIDGSKTSADGFAMLGLNAEEMQRKFAAGGPTAAAATSEVIRALAGMNDAALQEQAGVALFGTKFEELGIAAITAMDPATSALTDFSGAADRAGAALNDNAATNIETFKRTLMGTFVDVLGGMVLPAVFAFTGVLVDTLGPGLAWLSQLFRDNHAWLIPLLIAVGSFAGVLLVTHGAIALYGAITTAWAARVGIATAAQWLWNTALMANPILLVVAVLVALGAALVWAYNNVDGFRAVVDQAWAGLQAAGAWIGSVFVGIWGALVAAVQWAGSIFQWLWSAVLAPTFGFIGAAALLLKDLFLVLVITPIILYWQLLAGAVQAGYQTLIAPTFAFFGAVAMWLWATVLAPIFGAVGAGWALLTMGVRTGYDTAVAPTFRFFAAIAQWLWSAILAPTFAAARAGWAMLGDGLRWVYDSVIAPIFGFFAIAAQSFADTFSRIVGGIRATWATIQDAFRVPVRFVVETVWNGGIGGLWGKAKALGLPIGDFPRVILPPGFNEGGPVGGWSPHRRSDNILARLTAREWVMPVDSADYYGTDIMEAIRRREIPAEALAGYAGGGPVTPQQMHSWVRRQLPGTRLTSAFRPGDPGWHGRNRAADLAGPRPGDVGAMSRINQLIGRAFPAAAELIFTGPGAMNLKNGRPHTYPAGTRAAHRDHVHWANNGAGEGAGGGGGGGFWGGVVNFFRGALEGIFDAGVNGVRALVQPVFPRNGSFMGDLPMNMLDLTASKVRDFLFAKADTADSSANTGGGAGVEQWRGVVMQALGMLGLPGSLAGTTLRRMNQESSGNPRAINDWDVNARRGTPSKGLMQVIDPTFRANRDSRAPNDIWNPLANILASMKYTLRRYGSLPAGYNRRGGYDLGGVAAGTGIMLKDVIAPERVLDPRQTEAFEDLVPWLDRMDFSAFRRPGVDVDRLEAVDGGRSGPAVEIVEANFYDGVDVDQLMDKAEFETRGGRL